MALVMEQHGLSHRRACRLVGIDHSMLRYQCKRPDDTELRGRLRELAYERRRFGYRRLGWLLTREGHAMNHKKLFRLYRGEKLMVRRRGGRKRASWNTGPDRVAASHQSTTSSLTHSPTAAASAFYASSMTSAGSAWHPEA